jgi:hypothetical protein
MFTALTTLAAVAALNAQVVTANAPAAPNTVSAPAVTAVATTSKHDAKRGARIPGTFEVTVDQNALEGVEALYVVRTGDGA